MEAYTHYGKQADVFKHLVLCEVLNNEIPTVYIDTNSNSISCNPGILGSGLLASNLSDKSNCQLLDFSHILVGAYKKSLYKGFDGSLYNEFVKLV